MIFSVSGHGRVFAKPPLGPSGAGGRGPLLPPGALGMWSIIFLWFGTGQGSGMGRDADQAQPSKEGRRRMVVRACLWEIPGENRTPQSNTIP